MYYVIVITKGEMVQRYTQWLTKDAKERLIDSLNEMVEIEPGISWTMELFTPGQAKSVWL